MTPSKDYNASGNPYSWEEIEALGLHDFRVFLIQVWAYLDLPRPTPVQLDLARNLQHGPRRLIIQAFRGVGKSWITVAFACWLLFMNPQIKIEVISASGKLAEDWVKFCFQIINGMPVLGHLIPRKGRAKSTSFDVGPATDSKDPSVKAAGINGQITGSRADVIIPDDIEIPANAYTAHLREKLADQVKEFDAILKPGGRVLYLGTPQTEESLYPRLANERGYKIRVWPAEIPEDPSAYHGNLAPMIQDMIDTGMSPGDPTDPQRFDKEDLTERRLSYGKAGFALQFMLDTNPSDIEAHPLKLSNLMVMDLDDDMGPVKLAWGTNREQTLEDLAAGGFRGDRYFRPAFVAPEMAKWTSTVMAIDPSGMGTDETSYCVMRYLFGWLYVVEVGGFEDGFGEATLSSLAAIAARHGVNYVVAETNYGGGMFNKLLMPHLARYDGKPDEHGNVTKRAGSFDEEWNGWVSGQKELRILDTLEPLMGSHKLVIDRRVVEKDLVQQHKDSRYSLIQQLTRITRDKGSIPHDDRIEAVAMAARYFTDMMNRDADKEHAKHKEKLTESELKAFVKNSLISTTTPDHSKRVRNGLNRRGQRNQLPRN